MKKAGELLSVFFDKKTLDTAQTYANFLVSWETIVIKCKIPKAQAHSRVVDFEHHIILIEADHPGWIQILQSKQRELLEEFRRRFPDFTITGISFRLNRKPPIIRIEEISKKENIANNEAVKANIEIDKENIPLYEKIQDDDFRESLKRLEKNVILRSMERENKENGL